MPAPYQAARQQKFASEEVHNDFSPLTAAIVHHPLCAHCGSFGGPIRLNLLDEVILRKAFELQVTNFVGDEKCFVKIAAYVFIEDHFSLAVEEGASSIELRVSLGHGKDVYAAAICLIPDETQQVVCIASTL